MSLRAGAIPRIWAGALFELAKEKNELGTRLEEVRVLLGVLGADAEFLRAISSPKIEGARKAALVREVFGDRFSRDLLRLVLLLIEKNRQGILTAVLDAFVERCEEEEGRLTARVTTAVPLERGEAEALARGLSGSVGKRVVLEEATDLALIGGAVLRFGDFLVDGSLRTRIRELRERLLTPSEK